MTLITVEIDEDEEHNISSAIQQFKGVLAVHYDWPLLPKEKSKLTDPDAAWMFQVDRKQDAKLAAAMLTAFAAGRKGQALCIPYCIDSGDPLPQRGYIGFKCCPDGAIAEEEIKKALAGFGEGKKGHNQ